ncbi:hypothetical protein E2C01_059540 [Portunus trituberculatus]|uniref:Uncharacterized protein n=1 Tax=Portunus trituberculatus TaxID=210409 RepID=A0A5B7H650_PORTR|nr:hypothetical protein [Portunus trituberculatus]
MTNVAAAGASSRLVTKDAPPPRSVSGAVVGASRGADALRDTAACPNASAPHTEGERKTLYWSRASPSQSPFTATHRHPPTASHRYDTLLALPARPPATPPSLHSSLSHCTCCSPPSPSPLSAPPTAMTTSSS